MVRISTEKRGATWVVRVSGQLGHENLAAFDQTCLELSEPVELDLSDLRGVDEEGVAAIRAVIAKGARVSGASPYITLRLGRTTPKGDQRI
jgi:ABC-type transporter Mla MlaB component